MPTEELLQETDIICRIVSQKKKKAVNFNTGKVRHSLFCPVPEKHPGEVSVVKTTNLTKEEIKKQGIALFDSVLGWAEMSVNDIHEIDDTQGNKLKALRNGDPFYEHTNIKVIPIDRGMQKLVAIDLAEAARLKTA